VLVKDEAGRPVVREMLNSSNEMVRNTARRLLWEQRDPSVTIEQMIAWNQGFFDDERDMPAWRRLAKEGNKTERYYALMQLMRHEPKTAWPEVRPLLCQDEIGPETVAGNIIGDDFPDWLEQEIIRTLENPEGLSAYGKAELLERLCEKNCIKPEAVALYRRYANDSDYNVRHQAYECLWSEASDASMALLARKALGGDDQARWVIGGNPDKRLTETFAKFVAEAMKNKETWVGGYVHCWPAAPGVVEYVNAVGSHYASQLEAERQRLSETPPD